MPRLLRADHPGSWHHLFNRGIARRTMFERREDRRFFLACLAHAVRRGELEVHAYCLMATHYHLLVRSPRGELAGAMQRIQHAYSRWFNRSRRRDGSLVRGRFGSRPVRSLRYRRVLVRYIDFNPCAARIVEHPALYPWGSAAHYAKPSGPPWLERSWVEGEVAREAEQGAVRPDHYDRAFPARNAAELSEFVHARMDHEEVDDCLDDIVGTASIELRSWMMRKAALADGTRPGLPLIPLGRLRHFLESRESGSWVVDRGRIRRNGWEVAYAGLGRDLCGATLTELADRMGLSLTVVRRLYALHRAEMDEGSHYAAVATELARRGLDEWNEV